MSGMVGKVRRAADSDEFDLANYDQARCEELAKGAFSEPLPLNTMVRLSFVVGGGKLVRQKYTDDLPKLFMGALSAVGYKDDSSASVEAGSGGKFKFQHDTGKNLKFVHVFPEITGGAQADAGAAGDEQEDEEQEEDKPMTPLERLIGSDDAEFSRLLSTHLTSWSQKKRLLEALKERIARLEAIEQKMARLENLSAEEQGLYDGAGVEELKAKVKTVTNAVQHMVEEGELTSAERTECLEQLEGKLEALKEELSKAEAEGKAKKVAVMKQQEEVLRKTIACVKDAAAKPLPPLRHEADLCKLHRRRAELLRIEKEKKGHYTMDELKQIGDRPEIEEAIEELESRSRGWLEDDEVFKQRVRACIAKASAGGAKKAGGGSGGGGGGGGSRPASSGDGFTRVGGGGAKRSQAKAGGPSMKNSFAALG